MTQFARATIISAVMLVAAATSSGAQTPGTDIYVAPLGDGASSIGTPRNLTQRAGYDNQPAFTLDGAAVLYTSIREDAQADIWRVPLQGGAPVRVTATAESEYSATPFGNSFATVRVEADSTQRLWSFPAASTGSAAELLVPGLAPVGYFAFVRQGEVATFVLGEPPTLQLVRTGAGAPAARTLASDIGRSIHAIPGAAGSVSYMQKGADGWWIMGLRAASRGTTDSTWRIAPALERVEDYAWAAPGVLVSASGSVVHRWRVGEDTAWAPVADLSPHGVRRITRLAVSPNGGTLALVAQDAGAGAAGVVPGEIAEAWQDLAVLSADSLLGRATGTIGERKAARYLAARFAEAGLTPGGDDGGFLQRVPIAVREAQAAPPAAASAAAAATAATTVTASSPGRRVQARAIPGFALPPDMADARLDTATNVIGIITGSDPVLRDEIVLVTAHFDHVGVGRAVDGDSIYNGADDDASGTAAMLEIARRLKRGEAPKRTVVFAAMTGEETGLIGTRWYIEHPYKSLDAIVANLNLEMLARPDTATDGPGNVWLTGNARSTMEDILAAAGVPVVADPRPDQNFFERSDNIAFARLGIVAHTLSSFGLHGDYHRPSDELETVDPQHFAAAIDAVTQATLALANGERPAWKPGGRPQPR